MIVWRVEHTDDKRIALIGSDETGLRSAKCEDCGDTLRYVWGEVQS